MSIEHDFLDVKMEGNILKVSYSAYSTDSDFSTEIILPIDSLMEKQRASCRAAFYEAAMSDDKPNDLHAIGEAIRDARIKN